MEESIHLGTMYVTEVLELEVWWNTLEQLEELNIDGWKDVHVLGEPGEPALKSIGRLAKQLK